MGLLSLFMWPVQLMLHSVPGQLAVFLLEKTVQTWAYGIEAVVARGTVVTVEVDPAKSGAKEDQGKAVVRSDKRQKRIAQIAASRNEGYLIRAAQLVAQILRRIQNWLRSLQGKAPSTDTREKDDDEDVVTRKRSEKVGLVTWVFEFARFALSPLNEIVLVARLVEHTRGMILVFRNKSSDSTLVERKSSPLPSKRTKIEDDGTTNVQTTAKPIAPPRAGPTKPPAPTSRVTTAPIPSKIQTGMKPLVSPTTLGYSRVKIAPYRTSLPMSGSQSKVSPRPAGRSTPSIAPPESSTKISEDTDGPSKLEKKTKGSINEAKRKELSKDVQSTRSTIKYPSRSLLASTANPSAQVPQIPPGPGVSKPCTDKSSTVGPSAAVLARSDTAIVVQSVPGPAHLSTRSPGGLSPVSTAKFSAQIPIKPSGQGVAKILGTIPVSYETQIDSPTIKSPGGPPPASTATSSAQISQISKPSTEKTRTAVPTATIPASPKGGTPMSSLQSVTKPVPEAEATDSKVPAKFSAAETNKPSDEGISIDTESRKRQTDRKELGLSEKESPARRELTVPGTLQTPPGTTAVKTPAHSTGPVTVSTASPTAKPSPIATSARFVFKTNSLPSKIYLTQRSNEPVADTPVSPTSTKSPIRATGKSSGSGLAGDTPVSPTSIKSPTRATGKSSDSGLADDTPVSPTSIQSPTRATGKFSDSGLADDTPVSPTSIKSPIRASGKSSDSRLADDTPVSPTSTGEAAADIPSDSKAAKKDNTGKSGSQSKRKPWKKWKAFKK